MRNLPRRLAMVLLILGLALLFVVEGLLPWYLETRIPRWAAESGLPGLRCEVRRVGLTGADLGQVVLGGDQEPPLLRCSSLQISYSLAGLLKKTIDGIHIGGLSLTLLRDQGGWGIPGLALPAASGEGAGKDGDWRLPLRIKSVTLAASEVIFLDKESTFRLPVELTAQMPFPEKIEGTATVFPFGAAIRWQGAVDLQAKRVSAKGDAPRLPLRQTAAFLGLPCAAVPGGHAGMTASFDVELAPFQFLQGEMDLVIRKPSWQMGGFAWTGRDPFSAKAVLKENRVYIEIAPVTFEGSLAGVFEVKEALLELIPQPRFSGLWNLHLGTGEINGQRRPDPFLSGTASAEAEASGRWRLAVDGRRTAAPKGAPAPQLTVADDLSLGLGSGELALRGEGQDGRFRVTAAVDLRHLEGWFAGDRLRLGRLAGTGRMEGDGSLVSGATEMQIEKIAYDQADLHGDLPAAAVTADFASGPAGDWQGRAQMKVPRGALQVAGEDFHLTGLTALLPWRFPFTATKDEGHLRLAGMSHGKIAMGRVDAVIRQERKGFSWRGNWKNILTPKMALHFDGRVDIPEVDARVDFRLERRDADLNPLLAAYAPELKTMELRSDLRLQGRIGYTPCGLYGHGGLFLEGLSFHERELKLRGEDINLHLEMSDLFAPRSRPAQKLSFGRISLGEVVFENGQTFFQVEPGTNLLVEKATLGWCGGKIHSESFRFRPDMEELDVVLYGDRIQLAQILEQLGAGRATGGGALNGRIPVHYQNGKWTFSDGFLYSTPGEGGVIHVAGMDTITAGLPENDAVSGQLKLAEAALKDYEYRWARVGINTEREDLLVTLQMDGKPADLLPFVYRRDLGGFVKAEAGFPGSRFQGIRLDLNFRFPLDQMMRYKNLLRIFY